MEEFKSNLELLGYSQNGEPIFKSEDGQNAITKDNQLFLDHIYISWDDMDVFDLGTYQQIIQKNQIETQTPEQ